MSEPQADPVPPDPMPSPPRRLVPEYDYRTAYIQRFLIRMPQPLHDNLSDWASRETKSPGDLVIEILEDAFRKRKG